ncbi:LLM class flavin-dependent oxidoreductase [Zavarzinia sp. CC-PAN008]|uniref:LLM class flavin-dependent oxidoreductase n=1 Tax=Zavarzinia sp. CC-PAN008 TaxID=3243332 RepID=UPI003F74ABEF
MASYNIPFSVLDLAPIVQGGNAGTAFRSAADLARHAERLGYKRYWLAEHHNMPGIASAATAVVIGHVAAATKTIRVGSGGIMLPNHAPLVIAEQFGTLAAIHPGRIDLGVGRAPGTDQRTAQALRRYFSAVDSFPQDVVELMGWFKEPVPNQAVQAVPGGGLDVPVWILGSSTYGAQLAAMLGLPFGFASHFAPDMLLDALHIYRDTFKPSEHLSEPYALACINVFAADTDQEAKRLFTTLQQAFIALRTGRPGLMPPPLDDPREIEALAQRAGLGSTFRYAAVGSPSTVREKIEEFLDRTQVNELMATGGIYDHQARLYSFEILAGIRDAMHRAAAA